MHKLNDQIVLSASDLSNFIACPHATFLDLQVANGVIDKPKNNNAVLQALQQKGEEFEAEFIQRLRSSGKSITEIDKTDRDNALQETLNAIKAGKDIIYQARLEDGIWNGWADFLIKVEKPGELPWSYEVVDTKLSRETKAGAVLQICLYSDILEKIQGCTAEHMHIYNPNGQQVFRTDDFMAYYRLMKEKLIHHIEDEDLQTYPEPVPHCDICRWWSDCNKKRRRDDHLSFIAGMGSFQIKQVKEWGVETLKSMAELHSNFSFKPTRGSDGTYKRLAHQACLQLKARTTQSYPYELLPLEENYGFYKLPIPSEYDLFFDFEGDPFVGSNGLEYLFGWWYQNQYHELRANNEIEEKKALEDFLDIVTKIRENDPTMHVYHFGAYEQSALKRLVGKYATREEELDVLLRAQVFVNLHPITHHAIIAGIESYSLKDLEKLHGYLRAVDLEVVRPKKYLYEGLLESGFIEDVDEETKNVVREYNKDDCISTEYLRNWLECERAKLISAGNDIPRPVPLTGTPTERISEHQERIKPLYEALLKDVPVEKGKRGEEENAKWILANMLDWYRREQKSFWWEVYRLRDLTDEELLEERDALSELDYTGRRENEKKSFVDYYTFPDQDCTLETGKQVSFRGEKIGTIFRLDLDTRIVGIKKAHAALDIHPTCLISEKPVPYEEKEKAILRLADWVNENGVDNQGRFRAGRDLLLRKSPTLPVPAGSIDSYQKAIDWVRHLNNGVLPIQGPPGTGKSFTASRMILTLIKSGKKVGITALSHKVIESLCKKVVEAAEDEQRTIRIVQKVSNDGDSSDPNWIKTIDNKAVIDCLAKGFDIAGGTAFMWAREEFSESVDYLFVDEAGQLSLIDTLALSHAGKNLILLGDPQQLKQPQKGSHPEGTDVSSLEHLFPNEKAIPSEKGVFLDKTWRMHPKINRFISELFYDRKLHPMPQNGNQTLVGATKYQSPGIYFEPVTHFGNQNCSLEEVERVDQIVNTLSYSGIFFVNSAAKKQEFRANNIKIISPYNAQVNALREKVASNEIQIGTVDKFQGQEAVVIIFSMASSSQNDAPRGMEFLYSLNRLNVAVSRAKVVFILVASPALLEPECRSPHQLQLANALCRLKEMANK